MKDEHDTILNQSSSFFSSQAEVTEVERFAGIWLHILARFLAQGFIELELDNVTDKISGKGKKYALSS